MKAHNVVSLPGSYEHGIAYGTVNGVCDGGYVVQGRLGVLVASVAFSCLLKPIAGDKVMYTSDDEGNNYILSILERTQGADAKLSFPGDVLLESPKGQVTIASGSGVDISSASYINLLSTDMSVSSVSSNLSFTDMNLTGDTIKGNVSKTRLFSDSVDVVAQRVTQRFKSCLRWVEQIEKVTAGQMLYSVRNLFSVRARQSAITAEDDVKVDGKRVHIG